jgi:hypothetical protein
MEAKMRKILTAICAVAFLSGAAPALACGQQEAAAGDGITVASAGTGGEMSLPAEPTAADTAATTGDGRN